MSGDGDALGISRKFRPLFQTLKAPYVRLVDVERHSTLSTLNAS